VKATLYWRWLCFWPPSREHAVASWPASVWRMSTTTLAPSGSNANGCPENPRSISVHRSRVTDPEPVVLGAVGMALIMRYHHLTGELLNRDPKGWLLSHDAGTTPLRTKALGAAISKLGASLGIEVSTHSFRRASAAELMASGVDVDMSARRLGHTTEVVLQSYVLGSDDLAIAAAGTLETRLAARGLPLAELLPMPK
jgi:hypothetical protein